MFGGGAPLCLREAQGFAYYPETALRAEIPAPKAGRLRLRAKAEGFRRR